MKYELIIDKNAEEKITAVVRAPSLLTEKIENLVRYYDGTDGIIGCMDDEIRKISFVETECITTMDRKVIVVDTKGNKYRVQKTLRELENILPSYFIRINKSSIANEHRILKFETAFSGGVDAVFQCGYREYVSRRCFSEIKRRYDI